MRFIIMLRTSEEVVSTHTEKHNKSDAADVIKEVIKAATEKYFMTRCSCVIWNDPQSTIIKGQETQGR
jgi:coenzyme F420-reducing hydrogenase beta subunit